MRIGLVAGEASGDTLGETLIEVLQKRYPNAVFEGIAGPKMQRLGARSLYDMSLLSVRGYSTEVLCSLWKLLRIRRELRQHFLVNPPDLFVGIDAPDFNLALEKSLKVAGIPVIHFVAPSVWIWRSGRIPLIREAVHGILALFPFEQEIFERAHIPIRFVGHPLARQISTEPNQEEARNQLGLKSHEIWLAFLPGSRLSEIRGHAHLMAQTAILLRQEMPSIQFLVPFVNEQTKVLFEHLWQQVAPEIQVRASIGQAQKMLIAANGALVASGTATLEAALCHCPHIITYRMSALSAWWIRRRGLSGSVGLPNIIAGSSIVPEYLQEQATPEILAQALLNLIGDEEAQKKMRLAFVNLHQKLAIDPEKPILDMVEELLLHGHL
jgi:lipid-A-disaccharide synthase